MTSAGTDRPDSWGTEQGPSTRPTGRPQSCPTDSTERPRVLTVTQLADLADLLAQLHATVPAADLDAIEEVSRLVNRVLFRRWEAGDVPGPVDVDAGDRL